MPFDDDLEDYRILRLDEVLRLSGLSRSQFLRLRAARLAPKGRRLGPRSVGYPRGRSGSGSNPCLRLPRTTRSEIASETTSRGRGGWRADFRCSVGNRLQVREGARGPAVDVGEKKESSTPEHSVAHPGGFGP